MHSDSQLRSEAQFRKDLQAAIDARHQANHPIVAKWQKGEVKRETVAGTITEIWYWISKMIPEALFSIAANAPQEVQELEMENYAEELDPSNPHPQLILRFAKACGISERATNGRACRHRGLAQLGLQNRVSTWIGFVATASASECARGVALQSTAGAAKPMEFSGARPRVCGARGGRHRHGGREVASLTGTQDQEQQEMVPWAGEARA